MLRLGKVGRGGQDYYLAVAAGTGTGIEPAGQWSGRGAARLALHGEVTAQALGAVLHGRHPGTAEVLSASHDRVRVAAFDLTFCAPKSVSLLHGLGDPDVAGAVHTSHQQAVSAALGYVERRAAAVRGPASQGRWPEPVDGLVTASFLHRTSRALDPHLHTHAVVANLGAGLDQPWRALDGRGMFAHRAAADAVYHAELRFALTARLGVRFGPVLHGRADIEGIGPEVRAAFSQRAAAIAQDLRRSGHAGPHAAELASHVTRPARRVDVSADDLAPWWHERAAALGLGPASLAQVLDSSRPAMPGLSVGEEAAALLSRSARPVARRHAVVAVCWSARSGLPAAGVDLAADLVLAQVAARAGVVVPPWAPGVAEQRVAVNHRVEVGQALQTDRGSGLVHHRDGWAASAGPPGARDRIDRPGAADIEGTSAMDRRRGEAERSEERLRQRLAARSMGCQRSGPGRDAGFDLGLG